MELLVVPTRRALIIRKGKVVPNVHTGRTEIDRNNGEGSPFIDSAYATKVKTPFEAAKARIESKFWRVTQFLIFLLTMVLSG